MMQRRKGNERASFLVYPLAEVCPLFEARSSGGDVRLWSRGWGWELGSFLISHVYTSPGWPQERGL